MAVQLFWNQLINHGCWANIYLLSPQRIVKVFRKAYQKDEDKLIRDEVRGSKKYKYALPILRIITVITPQGNKAKGMVKKYLPYKVSREEMFALYGNKPQCMPGDAWKFNYRKDYDGTIYYVDTQIAPCNQEDNWL